VSSADDNARAEARIEALPEARDRAFDTLSGGVLRCFSRLSIIESACRELHARVKALEARPARSVDPIERALDPTRNVNRRETTNSGAPDRRGSSSAAVYATRKMLAENPTAGQALFGRGKRVSHSYPRDRAKATKPNGADKG
jgi:hypothetical protein